MERGISLSGDNSKVMKIKRGRNRLYEAILEKSSLWFIELAYRELCEVIGDERHIPLLNDCIHDANDYIVVLQAGHTAIVPKNSPYSKKFVAEAEKAERDNDEALMRKRMNEKGRHQGI